MDSVLDEEDERSAGSEIPATRLWASQTSHLLGFLVLYRSWQCTFYVRFWSLFDGYRNAHCPHLCKGTTYDFLDMSWNQEMISATTFKPSKSAHIHGQRMRRHLDTQRSHQAHPTNECGSSKIYTHSSFPLPSPSAAPFTASSPSSPSSPNVLSGTS